MNVYIIESIGVFKTVKIGMSSLPSRRLISLSKHVPFQLRLVTSFAFVSPAAARKFERALHKVLKFHRLQGEWFALDGTNCLRLIQQKICEITKITNKNKPLRKIRRKRAIPKKMRGIRQKLPSVTNNLLPKYTNWLDRYLAERR